VYGAIHQFEGQVSVFNYTDASGQQGPTYRCLFPEQPSELEIPNCATIGVLGILPGTLGMYQANEVVKMVTGIGKVLSGEFLMIDLLENTSRKIKVKRRPDAEQLARQSEAQEQEEIACKTNIMKTLSVEELQEKLEAQEDLFLLDVRNPNEYEICHLDNSVLIPMNHVPNNIKHIPRDKPVVVYCHHGMRSASVIQFLEQNHQFDNLYNLTGGINAWAYEIDPQMDTY
jgi:adenylyltransferase/sulfurtransferase